MPQHLAIIWLRDLQPAIPTPSDSKLVLHPHTTTGFLDNVKQRMPSEKKPSSLNKNVCAYPNTTRKDTERQHHSTREKTPIAGPCSCLRYCVFFLKLSPHGWDEKTEEQIIGQAVKEEVGRKCILFLMVMTEKNPLMISCH